MHERSSKAGLGSWVKRPRLRQLAALLAIACAVSCRKPLAPSILLMGGPQSRASPTPNGASARLVVVLLTIDGVRWQELTRGIDTELASAAGVRGVTGTSARALTPNLHALFERGGGMFDAHADCPGIVASGPSFLSLPGYAEIISGQRDTGCRDNGCSHIRVSTLVDEFAQRSATDVAVVTSWPDMQRLTRPHAGMVAVSAGRHGGSTRSLFGHDDEGRQLLDTGAGREPFPGHGDFRPDSDTARLALHRLATRQPTFTWIGLGEPDEYGHGGDYAGYLRSLSYADSVVGQVDALLTRMSRAGSRTALFVTTDHGRAYNFRDHGENHVESGRVWLVAAGTEIRRQGQIACSSALHLADIAPTIRALAGLSAAHDVNAGQPIDSLIQRRFASSGTPHATATPRASLRPDLAY